MEKAIWHRIKEIFQDALDLPGAERVDFARARSEGDDELFQQVKDLLDSYDEADDFIEHSTVAVAHFVSESPTPSVIGQQIGAYRIEREIGRGGMGAVYLARRADREFQKLVAVKLIKRGFDTDEIIRRFRTERQILAGLDHPNITRLIDGGATLDGLPYLVMDYVEGQPLTKYCVDRHLSINDRLGLFLQVCAAVRYAHQNLIIHRDLKPSNVLVTSDGTPKLLDFGIAKLIAEEAIGDTQNHTMTRVMTPEYASPEQIKGLPITTSTDVYSLGVILYELLTGDRPFKLKTNNPDEISKSITASEPLKPSSLLSSKIKVKGQDEQRTELQNLRSLRGDLDNIVLMAMRKEPERRYGSVEQFAGDVERFLSGLPVLAQEDTFLYRASKFIGRNKTGVAAAAGVGVSLIVGIIASSRQSRIAQRERDTARREARKAERVNQFLQKTLSTADPSEHGKDTTVLEALALAAEEIETEFPDQPEIRADFYTTIGRTYLNLGRIREAEPHLLTACRLREEFLPENSEDLARSFNNLGLLYKLKGDFSASEPFFRRSLEILEELYGDEHLLIAEVLRNYVSLLILTGRHEESIRVSKRELTIRNKLSGIDHPSTARTITQLSDGYRTMGDYQNAEKFARQALRVIQNHYPKTHPDVLEIMVGLGNVLIYTSQSEAEELYYDILATLGKALGTEHPEYAWALYKLAFLLNGQGRFDEAQKYAAQILRLRRDFIDDENPVVSAGLQVFGHSLMGRGDAERAEPYLRESLWLREKTLPPDHWALDTSKSILGECLAQSGKLNEARALLQRSYENLRTKLGEGHEQTQKSRARLENLGLRI